MQPAVAAAHGASTSRRTAAKKRRGRARRQQEGATNDRIQPVDEDGSEHGSDRDEEQNEPVAFDMSAYDTAREEKERAREELEATEEERIRRAQVRSYLLELLIFAVGNPSSLLARIRPAPPWLGLSIEHPLETSDSSAYSSLLCINRSMHHTTILPG